MSTFITFATYLSQPFSIDNWADSASEHAERLIQQFTVADWHNLQKCWHEYPSQWQQRCAEVLSWGTASQAIPLLMDMLLTDDEALTLTAIDTLRDFDSSLVATALPPQTIHQIRVLRDRSTHISQRILNAFLTHIEQHK